MLLSTFAAERRAFTREAIILTGQLNMEKDNGPCIWENVNGGNLIPGDWEGLGLIKTSCITDGQIELNEISIAVVNTDIFNQFKADCNAGKYIIALRLKLQLTCNGIACSKEGTLWSPAAGVAPCPPIDIVVKFILK